MTGDQPSTDCLQRAQGRRLFPALDARIIVALRSVRGADGLYFKGLGHLLVYRNRNDFFPVRMLLLERLSDCKDSEKVNGYRDWGIHEPLGRPAGRGGPLYRGNTTPGRPVAGCLQSPTPRRTPRLAQLIDVDEAENPETFALAKREILSLLAFVSSVSRRLRRMPACAGDRAHHPGEAERGLLETLEDEPPRPG